MGHCRMAVVALVLGCRLARQQKQRLLLHWRLNSSLPARRSMH
jgi:hypothetical protein